MHSRDEDTFDRLEPMHASHGKHCEAPPATHRVSSYEDAVFLCNDHVMTAINASAYGAIYLTPNRMIDFSDGKATLSFDMSTLRQSKRDWVDIWITPMADNMILPLEDSYPDLAGPPRRAVHIVMTESQGMTGFRAEVFRNHDDTNYEGRHRDGYENHLEPDAKRRDRFELQISETRIRFGMPAYDLWWVNQKIPALGWSSGVVQLGHHSYSPTKSGAGEPATWHWDNVTIDPAVPFKMIDGNTDVLAPEERRKVTFDRPAPKRACMRFAGIGRPIRVSFDGGRSWKRATLQNHDPDLVEEELFASYSMPIPRGVSTVRFRGSDWYGRDWRVRDPSIFAGPC